ncbi:MAG: DUF2269 family protein [Thermoanaerobaculia bacterium]
MNFYRFLKFLHVASVVLWVGGAFTMTALVSSVTRARDRALMHALIGHVARLAGRVMGPASGLTLLSGLAMLFVVGLSPATFWVQWGLAGILVHFVLGGWFVRRATERLGSLTASADAADGAIRAARRKLVLLNGAYLAVMLSVVAAMTIKPGP